MTTSTSKTLTNRQKLIFTLIGLLIICLTILGVGELTCRIFGIQPFTKTPPLAPYNTAQKDDYLGWKMTPNYTFKGQIQTTEKESYDVELVYDKNGFKAFGDPKSEKKKVFFIGDSYTASVEVSNDKTFYNLIKDSLDIEVFAYGHAGYSTLQEFLVYQKYLPIIQPDLVVWQTCSNDWIDNYADLEMESSYKVGERRPYITANGSIEYIRPITTLKKWAEYSSFMRFLEEKWQNISYKYLNKNKKVAEYWIGHSKQEYAPYAESIKRTNLIFDKIKAELPTKTKLVGFSAGIYQPQAEDFEKVFNNHGFNFSMESASLVNTAKFKKETVHSLDGYHWNERGHELVADGLINLILGAQIENE